MNCPNCGGNSLYESREDFSAGGGYYQNYLPGLGGFLRYAKFKIVVCGQCGAMQFFADQRARDKLPECNSHWKPVRHEE
jgi:hypothetical protein